MTNDPKAIKTKYLMSKNILSVKNGFMKKRLIVKKAESKKKHENLHETNTKQTLPNEIHSKNKIHF